MTSLASRWRAPRLLAAALSSFCFNRGATALPPWHPPLPLLLIVFSLLFDVIVTIGRVGTGASGAVSNNRYNIANLILLTGVFLSMHWVAFEGLACRWPVARGGPI